MAQSLSSFAEDFEALLNAMYEPAAIPDLNPVYPEQFAALLRWKLANR